MLGYSQGGPVALQLARDHPGLVGRLVLACTYAFNMASRRERVEGFLMPWMFRILGPRRLGAFVRRRPGITGGKPLTRQQAEFVAGLIAETPCGGRGPGRAGHGLRRTALARRRGDAHAGGGRR